MQSDSSHFPVSDVQARLGLLHSLSSGRLDALECPQCHECKISVRFTNPSEHEYRTWFICDNCEFEMRVQNSEKPAHFSEERIDEGLARKDAEVIAHIQFDPDEAN